MEAEAQRGASTLTEWAQKVSEFLETHAINAQLSTNQPEWRWGVGRLRLGLSCLDQSARSLAAARTGVVEAEWDEAEMCVKH